MRRVLLTAAAVAPMLVLLGGAAYAACPAAGATTSGSEAVGNINTTSAATIIADLNAGIVVNGVTYQMAPAIAAGSVASYQINSTPPLVFSPVAGATTP